jgi:hypothetical protein
MQRLGGAVWVTFCILNTIRYNTQESVIIASGVPCVTSSVKQRF